MIRIFPWVCSFFRRSGVLPDGAYAQQKSPEAVAKVSDEDADPAPRSLVVRVYPVADLLTRNPEYAYEGTYLPRCV